MPHHLDLSFKINANAQVCKAMEKDIVPGFICVMDGEKDPRNLVIAFQLVQRLIQVFDIDQYAEVCD